jgi:ketose-bisphosphate aldolase
LSDSDFALGNNDLSGTADPVPLQQQYKGAARLGRPQLDLGITGDSPIRRIVDTIVQLLSICACGLIRSKQDLHEMEHGMDSLRNVLARLEFEGAALGHFNVSDLVMLKAVLGAAGQVDVPVLVGASEGEREFFGVKPLAALVKSMREEFNVPVFINADHTHSLAKAVEAANAGFDEVVIDFSALPFDQNVSNTKETVEAIKSINPAILAEGEIGDIGTGSEIHLTTPSELKGLTSPEEARQFVQLTGIDALAPAVGNRHGMVESMVQGTTKKHLDIARIAQIKRATGVFLTLHGGSGTDDDDFLKSSAAGINIVHVSTELRVAWRQSLEASLAAQPNEVAPYKIFDPVENSVAAVVSSRLKLFNEKRTTNLVQA